MIALELNKNALSDKGWVYYGEEIKYTSNPQIIIEELKRIYKERIWIEIRYAGYKSRPTLVLSLSKRGVEIERPADWDASQSTVLLKYRPPREPWHSLKVKVREITPDSIFFNLPQIYAISERRAYFRVDVPSGSKAKVMMQKKRVSTRRRGRAQFFTGPIKDISIGGLCMYPDPVPGLMLPQGHMIVGPLILDLRINVEKTWPAMEIAEAEVVRLSETMLNDKKVKEIAFKFKLSRQEEENMANYIRNRELAIIKTGVT